jgi:hypothetical protein
MFTVEALREFFGWCSVINTGILLASSICLMLFRGSVSRLHARMFDLQERDLSRAYIQYLGQFKIAVFIFSVVPYFALVLMT